MVDIPRLVWRTQGVAAFTQHLVSGISFVKSGTDVLALSRVWLEAISFVLNCRMADKSRQLLQPVVNLTFLGQPATLHVISDSTCCKAQYAKVVPLTAL
jgi:hypothetical protein